MSSIQLKTRSSSVKKSMSFKDNSFHALNSDKSNGKLDGIRRSISNLTSKLHDIDSEVGVHSKKLTNMQSFRTNSFRSLSVARSTSQNSIKNGSRSQSNPRLTDEKSFTDFQGELDSIKTGMLNEYWVHLKHLNTLFDQMRGNFGNEQKDERDDIMINYLDMLFKKLNKIRDQILKNPDFSPQSLEALKKYQDEIMSKMGKTEADFIKVSNGEPEKPKCCNHNAGITSQLNENISNLQAHSLGHEYGSMRISEHNSEGSSNDDTPIAKRTGSVKKTKNTKTKSTAPKRSSSSTSIKSIERKTVTDTKKNNKSEKGKRSSSTPKRIMSFIPDTVNERILSFVSFKANYKPITSSISNTNGKACTSGLSNTSIVRHRSLPILKSIVTNNKSIISPTLNTPTTDTPTKAVLNRFDDKVTPVKTSLINSSFESHKSLTNRGSSFSENYKSLCLALSKSHEQLISSSAKKAKSIIIDTNTPKKRRLISPSSMAIRTMSVVTTNSVDVNEPTKQPITQTPNTTALESSLLSSNNKVNNDIIQNIINLEIPYNVSIDTYDQVKNSLRSEASKSASPQPSIFSENKKTTCGHAISEELSSHDGESNDVNENSTNESTSDILRTRFFEKSRSVDNKQDSSVYNIMDADLFSNESFDVSPKEPWYRRLFKAANCSSPLDK